MKKIALLILFMMTTILSAKENNNKVKEAFEAGKVFAEQGINQARQTTNAQTGQDNLPFYGQDAAESKYFQQGRHLITPFGDNKKQTCQTQRAGSGFKQQECDAVNFLSRNPTRRPKFKISKTHDPLLKGSNRIMDTATHTAQGQQNCRIETKTKAAITGIHTCTEVQTLKNLACRRTLNIVCDPLQDGCDPGGIVPNSWAGDMKVSFTPDHDNNFIFQFGTIADNYWQGKGKAFDRHLTFQVNDIALIKKFILIRAAFDDWLLLKINGHTIYIGPYGGDRLEVIKPGTLIGARKEDLIVKHPIPLGSAFVRYCEDCFSAAELGSPHHINPNLDLRPFLVNGQNNIFMRVIVGDRGHGMIQILTRQACPRKCHDQWDENECQPLEDRVR